MKIHPHFKDLQMLLETGAFQGHLRQEGPSCCLCKRLLLWRFMALCPELGIVFIEDVREGATGTKA